VAIAIKETAEKVGIVLDADTESRVADDQLRLVWHHATTATVVSTAFALVMAWNFWETVAAPVAQAWVVAKVLVVLPRIAYAQAFRRAGFPGGSGWRQVTFWLLAADGIVWGLAGFRLMQTDVANAALVIASLCGVASVASFGLQAHAMAATAYVVPIMAPMILGLASRGDPFGIYCAVGLSLYLLALLASARRSDASLAETFLLRMHAANVSADRKRALELAERQSAVKSQLLGTVSHELRTPIHGMLGIARLVHVESRDLETKKRMELVESSGTHLLGLVTDLIDVSRLSSGQMRIQELAFDLANEVERIADIYTVRAAEKGLTFTCESQLPGVAWVQGDPVRVRQVLHNLIGNAIKFTDKGWVHLMVSVEAGGTTVFEVRDTGVGIPEDQQAVVFEAFHQVGEVGSSRREGTGLGLTIAREVAKLLGGDITVKSRLGFGSIFRFTTPLPPATTPIAERQKTDDALDGDGHGFHGRVLLVEDNDVNALIAGSMLANEGHEVERVDTGAEAVRRALRDTDRPDVVLMDCMLPGMDGFEATRSIRTQERALGLPRIPIIALSAIVDDDGASKRSTDAGMDDALGKPFSAEQLRKVMRPWLALRASERQAAADRARTRSEHSGGLL
jgi:signal transduction histidine kinase/FixJ family two-component response regulator